MIDDKEILEKCSIKNEVEEYLHLYSKLEKVMIDAGYKKDEINIKIERKKKWDLDLAD